MRSPVPVLMPPGFHVMTEPPINPLLLLKKKKKKKKLDRFY